MSFTEDSVLAKLSALNETQESIVTVAQWILYHKRHADRAAQLWLRRVQDAGSGKRLNLIYLANEVVQQSKVRKKEEFMVAFTPIIAEASAIAYRGATNEVQQKLRRVVDVWRQRQIFPTQVQDDVEARLDELDKQRPATKKGQLGGSLFSDSGSSTAPAELQPLVPLQIAVSKSELTQKPALTAANTDYDAQTDPSKPTPTPPVQANRLNVLLKTLATAETAVAESIRTRQALVSALDALISNHRAALTADEAQQTELAARRASIEARKRTVEDQIAAGLAPADANDESSEPQRPEIERFTPPPDDAAALAPPGSTTPPEAPPPHLNPYFEPLPAATDDAYAPPVADPLRAPQDLADNASDPRSTQKEQTAHARPGSSSDAEPSTANGTAKRRKLGGVGAVPDDEFAGFGGDKDDAMEGLDDDVVDMLG